MNKTIIIIIVFLLSGLLSYYIDWKMSALIPFLFAGVYPQSTAFKSFSLYFMIIFVLWFSYSLWIDRSNQAILSQKIAPILKLPNTFALLFATSMIGGLLGGLSALSGYFLQNLFKRKERS